MNKLRCIAAVLLLAGFFLVTCDMDMGLGPSIDLEPPTLELTRIVMPDGTEKNIDAEDGKLFIGPGILVSGGFVLYGITRDNVRVEEIIVEETGANAELINGQLPQWSTRDSSENSVISSASRLGGVQEWSIDLHGIKKGIRTITITAYDKPQNIGPDSVKQLTLLVDTDPPFVDGVKIDRQAGIQVDLLSQEMLENFDPELFDQVDFFQNEQFRIRAAIDHDFNLTDVTLNLAYWDEESPNPNQMVKIFTQELARESGSVYAPVWLVTAADIIAANPEYASGRHYFYGIITAKAEAGHSSETLLNALCWYPEADKPDIKMGDTVDFELVGEGAEETKQFRIEKGGILPVPVFDDDMLGEVYTAMVAKTQWEKYKTEKSFDNDAAALESLTVSANRIGFENENGDNPLKDSVLQAPIRSTVIPVKAGEMYGDYRLVVLVRDKDDTSYGNRQREWKTALFNVTVYEIGIPILVIEKPLENSSPAMDADGNFNLEGYVLDVEGVNFVRVVWVPAYLGWNATTQTNNAMAALKSSAQPTNGIVRWDLSLTPQPEEIIGGKIFRKQGYTKTFNVFSDFVRSGVPENEIKFLMLYTQGKNGDDVFQNLRLMPYKQPPDIVIDPESWSEYGPGETVNFRITVTSALGVPIETGDVQFTYVADGSTKNLIRTGDVWRWSNSWADEQELEFKVDAKDKLGNVAEQQLFINIAVPPELQEVTSAHDAGDPGVPSTMFSSRDTVTIQAKFNNPVNTVNTHSGTLKPYITLENITNNGQIVTRNAYYSTGEKGDVLEFVYEVQAGDITGTGGLRATAFVVPANESNVANVSAGFGNRTVTNLPNGGRSYALAASETLPATKVLYVDGIAPVIENVVFNVTEGSDDAYFTPPATGWIRDGAVVQARVTVSKPVKVMGTPALNLLITNGTSTTRQAGFITMDNGDTVMVFEYKIESGDSAEPIQLDRATSFLPADIDTIVDKIGSQGNVFGLGGTVITGTNSILVDAVKPAMLIFTTNGTNNDPDPNGIGDDAQNLRRYRIRAAEIETTTGTKVEYTLNGRTWQPFTDTTTWIFGTGPDEDSFTINARQIDRAGNESDLGKYIDIDLVNVCDLVAVICDTPNGTYPLESKLIFRLVFNGTVYTTGAGPSITLGGGVNSGGVTQGPIILTDFTPVSNIGADTFSIEFIWDVTQEGRRIEPVTVTNVSLDGIMGKESGKAPGNAGNSAKLTAIAGEFSRPALNVLTIRPIITNVNGTLVGVTNDISAVVVAPSGTPAASVLTFTFNGNVTPEKGYITVRPAGNWHIPPVLTNDDYAKWYQAAGLADNGTVHQANLDRYYTKTTHGLLKNAAGQFTGEPDTSTKYVLEFNTGVVELGTDIALPAIAGAGAGQNNHNTRVQEIRAALTAAEYLWQKIDVSTLVFDTATETVTLDKLPDGRQWKIVIDEGAFLDAAGNPFAAWEWDTSATTHTVWSQTVADPVIRVNRVSNNHWGISPLTNTMSAPDTRGETTEQTSRINVQYRIDCETPGAAIEYGTWNRGTPASTGAINDARGIGYGVATITAALTDNDIYGFDGGLNNVNDARNPHPVKKDPDSPSNSAITDATDVELQGIPLGGTPWSLTQNYANSPNYGFPVIGGDTAADLYTARKDYIAARATRTANLSASDTNDGNVRSYEGAFKTLMIFRNPSTDYARTGNPYEWPANASRVRLEATNTASGAVTISGFPMSMNDMSGKTSKNTWYNWQYQGNAEENEDWIWISWEIVSDYYQVGIYVRNVSPNTELHPDNPPDGGANSWQGFSGDWFDHNFRKYGNWGLRIGY